MLFHKGVYNPLMYPPLVIGAHPAATAAHTLIQLAGEL